MLVYVNVFTNNEKCITGETKIVIIVCMSNTNSSSQQRLKEEAVLPEQR